MKKIKLKMILISVFLIISCQIKHGKTANNTSSDRVNKIIEDPDCVAFWDFKNIDEQGNYTSYIGPLEKKSYPLHCGNYVNEYWNKGRDAKYGDLPINEDGPFGRSIYIRHENDPTFRPYLYVHRKDFENTGIDIKGKQSLTMLSWISYESGNHFVAGIWHEGTDLHSKSQTPITKITQGERQYALFTGLEFPGTVCAHVSDNGGKSFGNIYAMHKSYSQITIPMQKKSTNLKINHRSWHCIAMTYDCDTQELKSWLDGESTPRWLVNVGSANKFIYNAWKQEEYKRTPGHQSGEDENYPSSQLYHPPENECLNCKTLYLDENSKIELKEFKFTCIKVSYKKNNNEWKEVSRDLHAISINPWWFQHEIYTPPEGRGGPFTIGRTVHSACSSGFVGLIGGVAVFKRALTQSELKAISYPEL